MFLFHTMKLERGNEMEKAYFPMKYYNLTQGYLNSSTHQGTYALDTAGKDTGKDDIYAPFSCKVTKKYVKAGHAYTIWLTSLDKVLCANGQEEYLTMMIVHPEDIANLQVGQTFKQGELVCHEGKTGNASGNHLHMELGLGTCGWHKNSQGVYMIDNAIKCEEYLFLKKDTIIKNDIYKGKKYSFQIEDEITNPLEPSPNNLGIKYTTTDLNERTGPGTNYPIVNSLSVNTAVRVYEINGSWARIETGMWVSNNFLTSSKPSKHYKSMEVYNCQSLNVRQNYNNGKILKSIPVNTVVSVLEEKNGWTKIGQNAWVYAQYLK